MFSWLRRVCWEMRSRAVLLLEEDEDEEGGVLLLRRVERFGWESRIACRFARWDWSVEMRDFRVEMSVSRSVSIAVVDIFEEGFEDILFIGYRRCWW